MRANTTSFLEEGVKSAHSATLNALSIPIKQRLYKHLLKLEDKYRWDSLLVSNSPQSKPSDLESSKHTLNSNKTPSKDTLSKSNASHQN